MRRLSLLLSFVIISCFSSAYTQGRNNSVLFIGNSYTSSNNLPEMVFQISFHAGKPYSYSTDFVETPGGATFQQHCSNRSMSLIQEGGWNYVILQEQSQLPSFPIHQVENECFPYAQQLVDSIYAHSYCATPIFFMTWGRENGDQENAQYFPPLGTYEGMDSLLYARYMIMKEENDAAVAPVGRVWRYIRKKHPEIKLYQEDGSHPSLLGTYAAACTFFTIIHQSDPREINHYENLDESVARTIIEAVRTVVYDSLDNWLRVKPSADFSATINGYSVQFENQSELAHSYKWIFENGDTSLAENAVYTFSEVGNHTVTLIAERHCTYDTIQKVITIDSNASIAGVYDIDNLKVYPNPTKDIVFIDNASKRIHSVALIDATGRILISQDVNDNSTSLNLQNMQRGLYILAVYTHKDAPIYRKIIVE